ncbi:MAG: DUF58 domain-containing protein, partial [Chloroflexi bacterium]|nr:DUF58 domain-containing protein [Chloroflexota bacterium]
LLVLAGVGWVWSAASLYGLHYHRHFAEVRAFQGEEIGLTLEVQNRKFLPLTWLTVQDIFPVELPIRETTISFNAATNQGEFRTFWMPNAFQRLSRHFTIQCTARGFHKYGPALVETGDGFGFFNRSARFLDEQFLIVYPRIYSVAEMELPAKNPFGALRAHGHLHEDPLRTVGVRAWASGDSPRRIHWKATARHQELLSRVYEPSKEQQILIFLNVATLERHWFGTIPELQERTISVAASLAALAAEQRLPVGLIANGTLPGSDQPLRLLPGRNPAQLTRILELLAAVTPFASDPIEQLLLKEAPRLGWGTTIVVVTAIAHAALLASLLELSEAGRPVVLFTLAEKPPTQYLRGIPVYHLPHLTDDLILPQLLDKNKDTD